MNGSRRVSVRPAISSGNRLFRQANCATWTSSHLDSQFDLTFLRGNGREPSLPPARGLPLSHSEDQIFLATDDKPWPRLPTSPPSLLPSPPALFSNSKYRFGVT